MINQWILEWRGMGWAGCEGVGGRSGGGGLRGCSEEFWRIIKIISFWKFIGRGRRCLDAAL